MTENNIVYQAHLHWVLFLWPALFLCATGYLAFSFEPLRTPSYILGCLITAWGGIIGLTYIFSSFIIKKKQVILCTGVLVRQTIDIPLSKIESIDIRQSVLGSILQYGTLVITGTGGTRQSISYLNKPLTCRRHIEQLMHN